MFLCVPNLQEFWTYDVLIAMDLPITLVSKARNVSQSVLDFTVQSLMMYCFGTFELFVSEFAQAWMLFACHLVVLMRIKKSISAQKHYFCIECLLATSLRKKHQWWIQYLVRLLKSQVHKKAKLVEDGHVLPVPCIHSKKSHQTTSDFSRQN